MPRAGSPNPVYPVGPGPTLYQRIVETGLPVVPCPAHEEDHLEAAGWSELLAEAMTGEVGAEDAALRIFPTPAMTLIDVDGSLRSLPARPQGREAGCAGHPPHGDRRIDRHRSPDHEQQG